MADRRRERNTQRVEPPVSPRKDLPKDRCTLTMLTGPTPGALLPLSSEQRELVLGREDGLLGRIADRGISGHHARVYFEGGSFWVEDLDSTNGTYINGAKIAGPRRLCDGDRMQLGENTLIRVALQDATEQEAARKMYDAAVHDPLTGLYNRGHLEAMLVAEFAYAVRHKLPLSLLFIDIDHFRQVNNTYGHQAGDAVLARIGATVRASIRVEDIAARYGGEELVVVARAIDASGSTVLAERVHKRIAAQEVVFGRASIRVTASIGVATFDATTPYDNVQQLVAAADRAVYLAKEQGRNRICRATAKSPDSWRAPESKR